uniref:Reverse transcriptase n=1 Tax=Schistosoma japonicum TaxID=6182 RepID=C7C212_SCHJA|nr:reverse transcriptase [Schistosoma japonicum]
MDLEIHFGNLYAYIQDLVPLSYDDVERLKSTLVDCCFNYINSRQDSRSILTKKHKEGLHQLKVNHNLIISWPDKGSGVVFMDRKKYLEKMNAILCDETKFQKLIVQNDTSNNTKKQLTDPLKKIKQQGLISESLFEKLKPTGTTTLRIYGLPKIYENGLPLRQILDMTNSASHSTAKWLVKILKPLHREIVKHIVKDSFEYVNKIKDLRVENKSIISLDASSLFTNVPLLVTVDSICSEHNKTNIKTEVPVSTLKQLILRCTMNVNFQLTNEFYRQSDSVSMGPPLRPLLADFILSKVEGGPLINEISQSTFYSLYVDDTFIVLTDKINTIKILERFNNVHPSITFTLEKEHNDNISFLDILLTRKTDGTLKRSIHRKSTSVCQYTHFYSAVLLRYKRNPVKSLTHRSRWIFSEDTVEEKLSTIRNMLSMKAYLLKFINKSMMPTKKKSENVTVHKKPIFLKLRFLDNNISEIAKQRIRKCCKRRLPQPNCILYSTTTVS